MDLPNLSQLESSEVNEKVARFIKANWLQKEERRWGFTIVRPSTLKFDEEKWSTALLTIRNGISRYFDADRIVSEPLINPLSDADAAMLPMRKLELVVLDLEMPAAHLGAADDAMIDAARERFKGWRYKQLEVIRRQDQQRRRAAGTLDEDAEEDPLDTYGLPGQRDIALLIDSQAMESLLNPRDTDPMFAPYVVAIDSEYQSNSYNGYLGREGYLGWTRVLTRELTRLFSLIQFGEMPRFCPAQILPGQIPLFDGTPEGTLIDAPGGRISIPEFSSTGRGTQRRVSRED